jgi:Xaa-Pro dipeptidase
MAAFETTEYRERVRRTTAAMQARGIDTFVVLGEANICYLTGYEGYSDYVPQALILRAGDQDPTLILREMDLYCAYPTVYLDESRIESYPESYIGTPTRSPWEVIGARIVEIAGSGRVGIELGAKSFSFKDHQALVGALGGRPIADASEVLHAVRIKKSPAELAYMRDAAAIVDRALAAGIAQIEVGVRECDVAATIMGSLARGTPQRGGGAAVPVTMPVTPRAAAPHLKWTDKPYARGSQTDFEVGAFVHRYCCALSRTAYLGDPPPRLRYVHDAVLEGFLAGFGAIRPGATCGDVHRAFARAFYPKGVRKESRIGYSIGLDWSDLCFSLQGDDATPLEVDYTMHLIIGIWEKSDAYVFSETIRVGPNGGESLSSTPRILFVR